MAVRTHKNPLEQALGQFATPEERDNCLRVCHAALSTAMVISLTGAHSMEKKGALGEAYSETIKLLESQMGGSASPYVHQKPTVFVSGRHHIPTAANNKH